MRAVERRIVIEKRARTLLVYDDNRLDRSYAVILGRNSAAPKAVEGDEATPLGEYYICAKNPRSRFFLSMCLSYPNAFDAQRGLAANLITEEEHARILAAIRCGGMPPQHTRLGGEIYIHGQGAQQSALAAEGTRGCIALANAAMQELYERIPIGTPVLITP
jgi:murein L,D-transpeptidase YafK